MIGLGPTLGQIPWHEKLRRCLTKGRGARLGEATVVSRKVHMVEPQSPQYVTILTGSDAGQIFYGRARQGEVIHLDIFHEVAEADHRRVAAVLRWALAGMPAVGPGHQGGLLVDYFDLATATGAGRITGDLSYGKRASLRAAHRNHVHLAGLLDDEHLHLLVAMVSAVESELKAQGVELRMVEQVSHAPDAGAGAPLDLSHYSDHTDSWLRGRTGSASGGHGQSGAAGGGGASAGRGQGAVEQSGSLRSTRAGMAGGVLAGGEGEPSGGGLNAGSRGELARGRRGELETPAGSADGSGAGADEGAPGAESPWSDLEREQRLQKALELSRRLGSPDELSRVLKQLEQDQGWSSLYGTGSSQAPFVLRQLEDEGLVRRDIRGLRLTEAGRELARYLDRHLRDVKLHFRKLVRRMPASARRPRGSRPGPAKARPSAEVRFGPVRGVAPAEPGAWLGDLAVPETVQAAVRRTFLTQLEAGAPRWGLTLCRKDIHVHLRAAEQPLNICLLIDASASMAGRRILAAKHLARHLLVSTRDRVAVIAFQERDVRVYVPFTRDWGQVEEGLARIQPLGLTPLAHGLTQSLELIRASRVRRPLLLLITDGIPTVPKWSIDPLADALQAARCVGEERIPFGCIGLQPSRRYLEDMVKAARGTLHVVDELDEDALVNIAHLERTKTAQRLR